MNNLTIENDMKSVYKIYTDGACSGNPGPGGAAAVIVQNGFCLQRLQRGAFHTTNNRMEIMAVVMALKYINGITSNSDIEIYTDSQLVIGCMSKGWTRKVNLDLWQRLDGYYQGLVEKGCRISLVKVAGHSGDYYNEMVDRMAVEARNDPAGFGAGRFMDESPQEVTLFSQDAEPSVDELAKKSLSEFESSKKMLLLSEEDISLFIEGFKRGYEKALEGKG